MIDDVMLKTDVFMYIDMIEIRKYYFCRSFMFICLILYL